MQSMLAILNLLEASCLLSTDGLCRRIFGDSLGPPSLCCRFCPSTLIVGPPASPAGIKDAFLAVAPSPLRQLLAGGSTDEASTAAATTSPASPKTTVSGAATTTVLAPAPVPSSSAGGLGVSAELSAGLVGWGLWYLRNCTRARFERNAGVHRDLAWLAEAEVTALAAALPGLGLASAVGSAVGPTVGRTAGNLWLYPSVAARCSAQGKMAQALLDAGAAAVGCKRAGAAQGSGSDTVGGNGGGNGEGTVRRWLSSAAPAALSGREAVAALPFLAHWRHPAAAVAATRGAGTDASDGGGCALWAAGDSSGDARAFAGAVAAAGVATGRVTLRLGEAVVGLVASDGSSTSTSSTSTSSTSSSSISSISSISSDGVGGGGGGTVRRHFAVATEVVARATEGRIEGVDRVVVCCGLGTNAALQALAAPRPPSDGHAAAATATAAASATRADPSKDVKRAADGGHLFPPAPDWLKCLVIGHGCGVRLPWLPVRECSCKRHNPRVLYSPLANFIRKATRGDTC